MTSAPVAVTLNWGRIFTTDETAKLLSVPVGTLRWWRYKGTGPRSFRLGARKVMYRQDDLYAWLAEQYDAGDDAA